MKEIAEGVPVEHKIPKHQPNALLTQANPVSGTKYTVLDTTRNVRIIGIGAQCVWTAQPTPLEIWVTVDGQTLRFYKTDPATAVWYAAREHDLATEDSSLSGTLAAIAFLLEGRSVKVEAEITGGTVSNLNARVKWAKIG